MNEMTHWRNGITNEMRACAHDVLTQTTPQELHARSVAQCLSGVLGLVARRFSLGTMQRACAELAQHAPAWETKLGDLPRDVDGRVSVPVEMVAAAARGLYPLAGTRGIRAALAFWALERDPAVWMSLAEVPQNLPLPDDN